MTNNRRFLSRAFTKHFVAIIAAFACTVTLTSNLVAAISASAIDDGYVEYIDTDPCYFEDMDGNIWSFDKIYVLEEGEEFNQYVAENYTCEGVICHLYKGEETPWYVQPYNETLYTNDTDGTFEYEGTEYQYNLKSNIELEPTDRTLLYRQILGYKEDVDNPLENLQLRDFKKDGKINITDVVLFNKRYMSTPNIHCNYYNEKTWSYEGMNYQDFYEVLQYHFNKGEDEVKICCKDRVPTEVPEPAAAPETIMINENATAAEMVALARQLDVERLDLNFGK